VIFLYYKELSVVSVSEQQEQPEEQEQALKEKTPRSFWSLLK
jgi:hypothetical protein